MYVNLFSKVVWASILLLMLITSCLGCGCGDYVVMVMLFGSSYLLLNIALTMMGGMFQWSSTGLQVYGSRYEYFRWLSLAVGTKFIEGVKFVSGLMFGVVQILSAFDFLYCTQLLLISLPMCKTIMKPLMVRWCVAPPFGELWTMLNLNHKLIRLMLLERYLLDPNRVNSRLWSSNSFSIWFFCFLSLQLLFLGLGPSVSLIFFLQ